MSDLKLATSTDTVRDGRSTSSTPQLGEQKVTGLDSAGRSSAQRELAASNGIISRAEDIRLEAALHASELAAKNSFSLGSARLSTPASSPQRDLQFQSEVLSLMSESKKSSIGDIDEASLFAVVARMHPHVSQEQVRNFTRNNRNASADQLLNALKQIDRSDRGVYQATDRTISSQNSSKEGIRSTLQRVASGLQATQEAVQELAIEAADELTGGAITELKQVAKTEGSPGLFKKAKSFFGGMIKKGEELRSNAAEAVVDIAESVRQTTVNTAVDLAVGTAKFVKNTAVALADPKTYVRAAQATGSVVMAVGELGYEAVTGLIDLEIAMHKAVFKGIVATGNWLGDVPARWDDLKSIAKGTWNGACSLARGTWNCVCALDRAQKSAIRWVTDVPARIEDLKSLEKNVRTAVVKSYEWCTDFEARGQDLKNIADKAVELAKDPQNWKTLGKALLYATPGVGQVYFGYKMCTDATYRENVISGLKTAGNFAAGVCNSLGITDLAKGIGYLATTPYRAIYEVGQFLGNSAQDFAMVATGKMSADEFKERFKGGVKEGLRDFGSHAAQGAVAIKGGVMLAGELTGVTDVIMATKYTFQGNWLMAGMHAGFAVASAGSLVATVATGGAAIGAVAGVATLKTTAKQAAKQVLEVAIKEFGSDIGKTVTREVIEELSPALTKAGHEIALKAVGKIEADVTKHGAKAFTREGTTKIVQEVTQTQLREQFGEKITKYVENITHDRLLALSKMNQEQLVKELQTLGVDLPADRMKKMAASFESAIKGGHSDDQLVKALTESIEKPLGDAMEEAVIKGFRPTFTASITRPGGVLRQEIESNSREIAQKTGRQFDEVLQQETKELVEAGCKGVRKAVREVVHEAVEKGVKQAVKRLRNRHAEGSLGAGELEELELDERKLTEAKAEKLKVEAEIEAKRHLSKGLAESFGLRSFTRSKEMINGNGQPVLVIETFSDRDENGIYEVVHSEESIITDSKKKKELEASQNIFMVIATNEAGQNLECLLETVSNTQATLLRVLPATVPAQSRTRELV